MYKSRFDKKKKKKGRYFPVIRDVYRVVVICAYCAKKKIPSALYTSSVGNTYKIIETTKRNPKESKREREKTENYRTTRERSVIFSIFSFFLYFRKYNDVVLMPLNACITRRLYAELQDRHFVSSNAHKYWRKRIISIWYYSKPDTLNGALLLLLLLSTRIHFFLYYITQLLDARKCVPTALGGLRIRDYMLYSVGSQY